MQTKTKAIVLSKIRFKEVDLASAETLFKLYDLENQNLISQIR